MGDLAARLVAGLAPALRGGETVGTLHAQKLASALQVKHFGLSQHRSDCVEGQMQSRMLCSNQNQNAMCTCNMASMMQI